MSSIVVSGDTSGAITIAAPAVAGTNTLTLPAQTGTVLTTASTGTILQVLNFTNGTYQTSSSSTYVDTSVSLAITPKFSTSKILVLVHLNDVLKVSSDTYAGLRLLRNSTTILTFASGASYTQSTATNTTGAGCTYLDSPATTSAVTYKIQFASLNNTGTVQFNSSGAISSTMTLMEIAG